MSKILENIYIWVFLVNSESVLVLAFGKYMLLKNPCFVTKNDSKSSNIYVFIYPKNSRTDLRKIIVTRE